MGIAKEIGTAGLPPTAAKYVHGTSNISQGSAGSAQGDAAAVTAPHTLLTTVGASEGVILPSDAAEGDWYTISNEGGNNLSVYPPSGGQINNGTADAAVTVNDGTQALFVKLTGGHWTAVLGA